MSFHWDRPPGQVFGDLTAAYADLIRGEVLNIARRYEPEIEAWLKTNAPWVDRTGNARQSLFAETVDLGDVIVVLISHGVEYGVFLELGFGGRYAVIGPALDYFAPRIWQDIRRALRL